VILLLVEQGRLTLDTPAFQVLDNLTPPPGAQVDPRIWRITVRHLLQHSGGWDGLPSYAWIRAGARALGEPEPIGIETYIRLMLARALDFEPGTRYAYSNLGYGILGRIVERVTGLRYDDFVRTALLVPLGLTRMQIGRPMVEGPAEGEVRYYEPGAKTIAPGSFLARNRDASGGWIASAIDLVRFMSALDGLGAPPPLSPASVQQMRARPAPPLGLDPDHYYGLGWQIRPMPDRTVWSHAGSVGCGISEVVGDTWGFARAMLFNTTPESRGAFWEDAREAFRQARLAVTSWPTHDQFSAFARADAADLVSDHVPRPAASAPQPVTPTPQPAVPMTVDIAAEAARLQAGLIETLQQDGSLTDPAVAAAFRIVPRHLFLPEMPIAEVYRDRAIVTKKLDGRHVSSSSQPAMMAIMLEQLGLKRGHRVLEIGAGTGYNAALMAELVGARGEAGEDGNGDPDGQVVAIDVDGDIVEAARAHLAAAGYECVQAVLGDGALGAPDAAPFDRIVLTVAATDISPAWWQQLAPGGRLLLPLRLGGILTQKVVAFERVTERAADRVADRREMDHLVTVSVRDGSFIMLRGSAAQAQTGVSLGEHSGLQVWSDDLPPLDPDERYRQLAGPCHDAPTGITVRRGEIWGGLQFWLGLREPALVQFLAADLSTDVDARRWLLPNAYGGGSTSVGLLGEGGLALLVRSEPSSAEAPTDEILVRACGTADDLVARLIGQVRAWDRAGRPAGDGLRIRAYPAGRQIPPAAPDEIVVQKRHVTLVLGWPSLGARPSWPPGFGEPDEGRP
jgi:protein-L-isoaspartate(D-aspartate) O-methyltransferase